MGVVPGDELSPLHSIPGSLPSPSSPAPPAVPHGVIQREGSSHLRWGTLKKRNTKWSQKRANRYQGTWRTSRAGASSFHGRGGGAEEGVQPGRGSATHRAQPQAPGTALSPFRLCLYVNLQIRCSRRPASLLCVTF